MATKQMRITNHRTNKVSYINARWDSGIHTDEEGMHEVLRQWILAQEPEEWPVEADGRVLDAFTVDYADLEGLK